MSNIEENLEKIQSAVWGKDVRQAIHDSIHDCYEDGKTGSVDLIARERIDNIVSGSTETIGYKIETQIALVDQEDDAGTIIIQHEFTVPEGYEIIEACYQSVDAMGEGGAWRQENMIVRQNETTVVVRVDDFMITAKANIKIVYTIPNNLDLSEIEDIRVGVDGTVYNSAGGAVRTQIESLDSRVNALEAGQGGGSGLTQQEKELILTLFSKAVNGEADAKSAYDTLEGLWRVVYRTITYNLTNCISSSSVTSVENGKVYTTNLAVKSGYSISTATVMMGGVDVTSGVYHSGSIIINRVTGDIVITAVATKTANSITATYTQSGTVFDDDTLDSLKSDLVVTANYSDGTSETVTDYTLNGTLAEGTSVVTVGYGRKTATFSVVVSSATKLFNLASLISTIDGSEEVDTNLNLREYENVSIMLTIDTLSAFNWNSQVLFSDGGTTASCLQLKINDNGNVDFMLSGTSKTLNPTIIGVMSSTGQKQAPLVFTFEGMNTNNPYVTVYSYINNEVVATERWSKNITSAPNIGTKLYFAPEKEHSYNIAQRFQGTLTDIRVIDKIVSRAEITAYCEGE